MSRTFRIFAALAILIGLWAHGHAQVPMTGAGLAKPASGFAPSCSQSTAFLARATGITLTADKTNYDTLICGLNTDGVLAKLDALYIFAAPDSTTAKLNLVSTSFSPGTTTLSFSAYHGFTGDGATVFDTGFTPNTGGSNFVLNGASLGVYVLTSNTIENAAPMGSDNSIQDFLLLQPTFGAAQCQINGGTLDNPAISNSQGFWQCIRQPTTVGTSRDGATPSTTASTATGLDNITTTVFCRHDGSGAVYAGCTTDQMSSAFIGGAISNADVANLSSRINTFMTAYGINVY